MTYCTAQLAPTSCCPSGRHRLWHTSTSCNSGTVQEPLCVSSTCSTCSFLRPRRSESATNWPLVELRHSKTVRHSLLVSTTSCCNTAPNLGCRHTAQLSGKNKGYVVCSTIRGVEVTSSLPFCRSPALYVSVRFVTAAAPLGVHYYTDNTVVSWWKPSL